MKTLKFTLEVDAIESYIYSGHLFLILLNGRIAYSPLSRIIYKLINEYPDFENLIRVSFQRNDYLNNRQAEIFFGIGEMKKSFIDLWKKASEEMEFQIILDENDYTVIDEVPTMPVLDLKMYAMRLYIGSKEGLYEINLNSDDRYNLEPTKPQKRFDAKVTCLNAKSGEIIISSNSNGLFHGTFLNSSNSLKVNEKSVSKKSIRTGWSGYDVINYDKQNDFEYYVNETEKIEDKLNYSKFDENSERRRITDFGSSKFDLSTLLAYSRIEKEQINYCFNSSTSGFFFMKDGSFVNINLKKPKDKNLYFVSRNKALPTLKNGNANFLKPLSTSIVPEGCVVEYFDKVVLYQNSKAKIIEESPSINVRTYPSSKRYRNLISVTKEKEITIHSIFPFKEDSFDLTVEDFENNKIFKFI
ncbi:hypothetical protein PG913_08155 [Tenacibaculum pacificus]|uniref:hypothetical protein n=1 Tax=Tenacibaculum pacificus TaxID=3018314 RepID=UPI0022F3988C|nr:hypothetical protein [Tenacibaculum pacificus]WBX72876.1 hypothetical protein PG913_08155 [Tenacibaculum pacificus]